MNRIAYDDKRRTLEVKAQGLTEVAEWIQMAVDDQEWTKLRMRLSSLVIKVQAMDKLAQDLHEGDPRKSEKTHG